MLRMVPRGCEKDVFMRILGCSKNFYMKSCYKLITWINLDSSLERGQKATLRGVWRANFPSKIQMFRWRFLLDKLPTRAQLAKKGTLQSNKNKVCVLCFKQEENVKHLSFQSSVTSGVQRIAEGQFGISMPKEHASWESFNQYRKGLKMKTAKDKEYYGQQHVDAFA